MASDDSQDNIALRIDAQVVRQLGSELITDPEQALIELIKNAYDADATRCRIDIDTLSKFYFRGDEQLEPQAGQAIFSQQTENTPAAAKVDELTGRILVENDGPGVEFNTIKERWLLISGSIKRAMKGEPKATTDLGRTPIGDKGIGRLGTMRLGDRVTFTSRPADSTAPAQGVAFRWSSFDKVRTLDAVPVLPVQDLPSPTYSTRVGIEGLSEPDRWSKDQPALVSRVARLISPFAETHAMELALRVNNAPLELQRLAQDLETHAVARYTFDYKPESGKDVAQITLEAVINGDFFGDDWSATKVESFLEYFSKEDPSSGLARQPSQPSRWVYRIQRTLNCGTIEGYKDGNNPGPFKGRIYAVTFRPPRKGSESDRFPMSGNLKKIIQDLTGISIYRNGFGIRINPDWLGLSAGVTHGHSWYGLRKGNTVGYFDLDSAANAALVETSNREGFLDTPAWQQFLIISGKVRDEINDINEALRRAFGEFTKPDQPVETDAPPTTTAMETLTEQSAFARSAHKALSEQRGIMGKVSQLAENVPAAQRQVLADLQHELAEATRNIDGLLASGAKVLERDSGIAQKILANEIDVLREQAEIAYDFIGAGLAAEHFAHEVHPLMDNTINEISAAMKDLKDGRPEAQISTHLQAARSFARLAGKYLSTLDPMLRVYRDVKDTIQVSGFLQSYITDNADRFTRNGIQADFTNSDDFAIRFPHGRLMQVVDNLVRNSEYWLKVPAARDATPEPRISLEVAKPLIIISDNGLGVRRELEDRLFQMFVTDKPKQEGRGLGLFITREVLQRYGCNINLSTERNPHGQRYKFEIDLTKVIE